MRLLLVPLFILAACSPGQTRSPVRLMQQASLASTEFHGLYSAGFEEDAFRPCGSAEHWWVANSDSLRSRYHALGASAYEPVYAVIRGDTTRRVPAGHLGLYQRYVRIHEVIRVTRLDSTALQRFPPACPNTVTSHPTAPQ